MLSKSFTKKGPGRVHVYGPGKRQEPYQMSDKARMEMLMRHSWWRRLMAKTPVTGVADGK